MELIPAIDVLGGQVVRLQQGRYTEASVYDPDPIAVARRFERDGAERLHVVDLDGAREGRPVHAELLGQLVSETGLAVQVGGGVRNRRIASQWLEAGAARVVVGTAAVREPEWVAEFSRTHGGRVVVAIDARAGEVAVQGWTEGTGLELHGFAERVDGWDVGALLYTNIERDGTRQGPDVEGTVALQDRVRANVIASGGIGTLDDVRALARAGVRAAVCGRALYTQAFTLAEAIAASTEQSPC
jgi:phosphoribosylformimino-5-aminoimidazole carboxamide ribotide isomerase